MKKQNTRALAVKVLLLVTKQGFSFQPSLVSKTCPTLSPQDASFVSYLCFGVLRFYFQLEATLALLMKKPLKDKDFDLKLLLLVGLYQLLHTDIKAHAILNETVEACQTLQKPFSKGLLNGILREALRQSESLTSQVPLEKAHPEWLVKYLKKVWPEAWQKIIKANLTPPPMSLRVNLRQISRADYLQQLRAKEIEATLCPFTITGLILKEGCQVEKLPGFLDGWVSVQDCAAQLAAPLLELKPKLRVLDACAAPGGKMAHLLETEPDLEVLAIEKDLERYTRLKETLQRLKLEANTLCADANSPEKWFDGNLFDRILVDAPCSATGVIRRHPDICLHRQAEDIPLLAKQQGNILANLWPLLKPSGILLYVTCSLLPEENETQIKQFLQNHSDALIIPLEAKWGLAQNFGRQILNGQDDMDGFYYAKLTKKEH